MTFQKNQPGDDDQPIRTRPGFLIFIFVVFFIVAFLFFGKTMGTISSIIVGLIAALIFTRFFVWNAKLNKISSEQTEQQPPKNNGD